MLGTYALSSGYYDAYYGTRAEGAHEDRRRLPRGVRAGRPDRDAHLADGRVRARRAHRRPAGDVPLRRAAPCRCRSPASPRSRSRAGCRTACPWASSSRARRSARTAILEAAHALERAIGFDGRPPVAEYEPVIGLEIHVQLRTRTKMFCGCELSFGEEPNTRTCPVCLGHPGTLPVTNAEAVHFGADDRDGAGLRARRRGRSSTARTTSIPTCPKGYQISQYDIPLCARRPPGRRAHPPRAPRGGRGEARARRRVGPDPRRRGQRSSTSTAAARRWSRSSPSPTCAPRPRPRSGCGCCGPR